MRSVTSKKILVKINFMCTKTNGFVPNLTLLYYNLDAQYHVTKIKDLSQNE